MKLVKILLLSVLTVTAGMAPAYAHRDFDDRHRSDAEDYNLFCPWCDRGQEYDMSTGMNLYGDYRYQYNMEFNRDHKLPEPITVDEAYFLTEDYLFHLGIPGLRTGSIIEKENEFDAEIIRKDGSLRETLVIDKQTGSIKAQD